MYCEARLSSHFSNFFSSPSCQSLEELSPSFFSFFTTTHYYFPIFLDNIEVILVLTFPSSSDATRSGTREQILIKVAVSSTGKLLSPMMVSGFFLIISKSCMYNVHIMVQCQLKMKIVEQTSLSRFHYFKYLSEKTLIFERGSLKTSLTFLEHHFSMNQYQTHIQLIEPKEQRSFFHKIFSKLCKLKSFKIFPGDSSKEWISWDYLGLKVKKYI